MSRLYRLSVVLLIAACGDDDTPEVVDAGAPLDGGFYDYECSDAALCAEGRDPRVVPNFCVGRIFDPASAGLYTVCLLDPDGGTYFSILGGSSQVANPGWRWSTYGGGNIKGTLSTSELAHCNELGASLQSNPPSQLPCSNLRANGFNFY